MKAWGAIKRGNWRNSPFILSTNRSVWRKYVGVHVYREMAQVAVVDCW